MATYDFAQVLAHTSVDRNRTQRWCDAEIIRTAGGGSQGKRRAFTFRNLVEIAVCDELRGLGVSEPALRTVVESLNAIWDQPDAPINRQPDSPTYRDATILWLALQHYDPPIGDGIAVYPVTPADLIARLTDGAADGSGLAETGIAIPIARIIADLERRTGDVFDFRKKVADALRKALATGQAE